MLMFHDPDEFETVSEYRICGYHAEWPGRTYAGCTCTASFSQRRRSPEDVASIKAKRRREEEDDILARAETIKASRLREMFPEPREAE